MTFRCVSIAALSLVALSACALAQEHAVKLPIDLPKDASVNFEAEGAGKQILSTIKHLLSGDMLDPTAPAADKITIKTGAGNIDLKLDDLAPILEKIHALHVVGYTAPPNEDPLKFHERRFAEEDMHRVVAIPGSTGVLIMRHIGHADRHCVVIRQKDNVLVLRSDGAPGLGDFGRFLFEGLSRAIQQAAHGKHK